jgi:hypothetical protein
VPVPSSLSLTTPPRDFFDWTGLDTPFNYVVASQQAADVFVQERRRRALQRAPSASA